MHRRAFLNSAALSLGALALPRLAWGSQSCVPAVPTPYGSVQRCTAGIESVTFQQAFQKMPEWCWAACISMIFSFHGHAVSQERIVRETWKKVVNMPAQPSDILKDLNREWTDDAGDGFQSRGDYLSANNFNAVEDLKGNEPLIIGSMGHAMVLTALIGDTNVQTGTWQIVGAVVRDPWPWNGGRRTLSPIEWDHIAFAARVRVT